MDSVARRVIFDDVGRGLLPGESKELYSIAANQRQRRKHRERQRHKEA